MTPSGRGGRVLPVGDTAVLVEVADLDEVVVLAAAARAAVAAGELPGVRDVVAGARTVLLTAAPGTDLIALRRGARALPRDPDRVPDPDREPVCVRVAYDGPDLDAVAEATGLGRDGVVAAHTGAPWRVAFGGFAPGFAYLAGGDPRLRVARRAEPRTTVPVGSVGLADEFSGVYPRSSPGGWQLIGRSDATLWDIRRDPPALLAPGATVRFTAVAPAELTPAADDPPPVPVEPGDRVLQVLRTGPRATVQDLGRPGLAGSGVGASGAADRAALAVGNRLVANPPDAAGVEVLAGGLELRAGPRLPAPLLVAVTGAAGPVDVDGVPVGTHALVVLPAGARLRVGAPVRGLRSYLAVRGGVAVPAVLGSRSTDLLSGVGPAPLADGDVLPVGPEPGELPRCDVVPVAPDPDGPVVLSAVPGPRADWLTEPAGLAGPTWTVSPRSDRIGIRLAGSTLPRRDRGELPSEGIVRGAVQVPPGGEPVLFLADHPVTGGYPVVAVVLDADVDRAAQLRPGQQARFRLVPPPWTD